MGRYHRQLSASIEKALLLDFSLGLGYIPNQGYDKYTVIDSVCVQQVENMVVTFKGIFQKMKI